MKTEEERDRGVVTTDVSKLAAQFGKAAVQHRLSLGKLPRLSISEIKTSSWAFTSRISGHTWSFQFKHGHHGARRTRSCWRMSKNEQ